MHGYRDVIAIREVWTTLLLAALIRIPIFSLGIVMRVHVVSSLHLDYVRAGAVTTVVTVATMISGPWRGSMVDRRGLRRTMLPSLITIRPSGTHLSGMYSGMTLSRKPSLNTWIPPLTRGHGSMSALISRLCAHLPDDAVKPLQAGPWSYLIL